MQPKFLFIMNVVLGFSKVLDFFMIILHTLHIIFNHFENRCIVCSQNLNEVKICLYVFWSSFFQMIFSMFYDFLKILLLFLIVLDSLIFL